MARQQKDSSFDVAMQLRDSGAGAATATGVGQVSAANQVLDLGAARIDAKAVIDVSAIDTTSADEGYDIRIEGSNASDFSATVVCLGVMKLGAATPTLNSAATGPGRFEALFTNEQNGVTYRYLRVKHVIAGTTPSITYTARVVRAHSS